MRDHFVCFWIGNQLYQYGPVTYQDAVRSQRDIKNREGVRYTYLSNTRNPVALVSEEPGDLQ